jgi:uncharacterized integral membrane protein (TIGR00697 family)
MKKNSTPPFQRVANPETSQLASDTRAQFQYLDIFTGLFVATLIISNTTSAKPWQLGPFVLPSGSVLFPLSYLFGDVLTEVYGFARARRVIWIGFASNVLMVCTYWIVIALPPPAFWPNQSAYAVTLGQVPRIVLASFSGYLAGEFTNSIVLAKMKVFTGGRHLWARVLGSTVTGQAVDTFLFVTLAFGNVWPPKSIWLVGVSLYSFKVLYEAAATPFTYALIRHLKRVEGFDHFDVHTEFSPFRWEVRP